MKTAVFWSVDLDFAKAEKIIEKLAKPRGAQVGLNGAGVFFLIPGDIDDPNLFGRRPKRKVSGIVLDEDPHKALEATENCTVNHDGCVSTIIGAHVLEAKP